MAARLLHDPYLARAVLAALRDSYGKSLNYEAWLKRYVKPLARAAGLELETVSSVKRIHVMVPSDVADAIDEIAERSGVPRSEVVRFALELFLEALGWGKGGDGDA